MKKPPQKPQKTSTGNAHDASLRLAACIAALWLPTASLGQQAVILGEISDGTPPPPAPKPELPEFEILETAERQLPDRSLTVHRVKNPGLPRPEPAAAGTAGLSPEQVGALRDTSARREWLAQREKTTIVFLSATIVDGRATLLRWWHEGGTWQAWSNIDFNDLTGFGSYAKGDRLFALFLGVGNLNSASLPAHSPFRIPPDLPAGPPVFRVIQGDPNDAEALLPVAALHEIHANESARLRQARILREQRKREREAELLANPPVPEGIVLYHWKVQPAKSIPLSRRISEKTAAPPTPEPQAPGDEHPARGERRERPARKRTRRRETTRPCAGSAAPDRSGTAAPFRISAALGKLLSLLLLGCALLAPLPAAANTIQVGIIGTAANHEVSCTTRTNHNYQIEVSPDLQAWSDTGINEPGTGSPVTHGFSCNAEKLFYRIRETEDPHNGAFLTLPTQAQEMDLIDGVIFAFDMEVFASFPAKIRIYRRSYNTGDPWEQIGEITEFDERKGVKFVRGSVVWIPEAEGEYEVQAAAVDATGTVIASATRLVIVGENDPPVVEIEAGQPTPSADPQPLDFEVQVTDTDPIARVEFYANGVLLGTDYSAPFGDSIITPESKGPDHLCRGTHHITAKAYDSRGAVGETEEPFVVEITGGNAQPELAITSPQDGFIVQQGQTLHVSYTVSDPDGVATLVSVEGYRLFLDPDGDPTAGDFVWDDSVPFEPLAFDTTGWEPGAHHIKIYAVDDNGLESFPRFLTVYVRTGSGAIFAETLVANITDPYTVASSNERFIGVEASTGLVIEGIDSGLQMEEGIVMTTGQFSFWNGGNGVGNKGKGWNQTGDPILQDRIEGSYTNDAAVLEFDAFCSNSQLEIEYQFGSEECTVIVFG